MAIGQTFYCPRKNTLNLMELAPGKVATKGPGNMAAKGLPAFWLADTGVERGCTTRVHRRFGAARPVRGLTFHNEPAAG
jgi:hypothetical protein